MDNQPEAVTFDFDALTIGQAEFLTEYTGRSLQGLIDLIDTKDYTARDMVAILAVATSPDDPASAVDEIRRMPIRGLDLSAL